MRVQAYPYTISYNYRLLLTEENDEERFRQVIRTFWATLKSLILPLLCEYLSRVKEDPDGYGNAHVDQFLANRGNFGRPSLGKFADLFRRLVQASAPWLAQSAMAGLSDVVVRRGKLAKSISKPIDHLVHIRNLYFHSDNIPKQKKVLRPLVEKNQEILETLLRRLDWMADGQLWIVKEDGETYLCREQIASIRDEKARRPLGIYWTYQDQTVEIPTFLIEMFLEEDQEDGVMQYESLEGNNIKYLLGINVEYSQDENDVKYIQEMIKSAQERLPETRALLEPLGGGETSEANWGRLVKSAKVRSETTIKEQEDLGKYLHAQYTERREIESAIHTFLDSDKRLMVIVGESGYGKTNILCHLAREFLNDDQVVLHYYGRLYTGEKRFTEEVAGDLVWDTNRFDEYLKAYESEPTRQDRKLVILVDAINEYSDPGELVREILALVERDYFPSWIKVIATSRPVAWKYIEDEFPPNYEIMYSESTSSTGERRPYVSLGPFTEDELQSAWAKYIDDEELPESPLPERISHLLHHPVLFRFYADSKKKQMESGNERNNPPETQEEILLGHFSSLDRTSQKNVDSVVDAMWALGKDFMMSDEYIHSEEVEPWLTSGAGEDWLSIFGCEEHPSVKGELQEYNEREYLTPKTCRSCGKPLVRIREDPLRHPLDILRHEGILSLYTLDTGDQLLRFTYDRLYETLTGKYILKRLDESDDPSSTLLAFIKQNGTPDRAPLRAAIKTALFIRIHGQKDRQGVSLDIIAEQPAAVDLQDFLYDFLVQWAERDFQAAWEYTRRMLQKALQAWKDGQNLVAGLRTGLEVLIRFLELLEAEDHLPEGITEGEITEIKKWLIEIAYDATLQIDWEGGDVGEEQAKALSHTNPNDLSFDALFEYANRQAQTDLEGSKTVRALHIVREVLNGLKGVSNLYRHRHRIKQVFEWTLRLVSTEIRNDELIQGTVRILTDVLKTFPLLKPRKTRLSSGLRALLMRVISVPLFAAVNRRVRRMMSHMPKEFRAHPDSPPPTLNRLMHVTEDMAKALERIIDLLDKIETEFQEQDIRLLHEVAGMRMDEPLAGLMLGMQGIASGCRYIRDLDGTFPLLRKMAETVKQDEEIVYYTNSLTWGIVRHERPLTEEKCRELLELTFTMIEKSRKRTLERYEVAGVIKIFFCPIQFSDIFREDGKMPGSRAVLETAANREDWAILIRFWDNMLVPALFKPKAILRHVEEIMHFEENSIGISWAHNASITIDGQSLVNEAGSMPSRYAPDYDPDDEDRPEVSAVLHLLGTLGTLERVFPREVGGFFRRNEVPETMVSLIRSLASPITIQKIRDERLIGYFFLYIAQQSRDVRRIFVDTLGMLYQDAKRRNFSEPRRKDLVKLMSEILDRTLEIIYGGQPNGQQESHTSPTIGNGKAERH